MVTEKDLYKVLGVGRSATDDEIKKAYRRLARKNHPDLNPGDKAAEERFKDISGAFDVLSNKEKKSRYDEFGVEGLREGFDPDQARAYQRWGGGGGGFEDIGSIFGDLFGGRRRARPSRGRNVEGSITVDFLTAIQGGDVTISIQNSNGALERVNVKVPPGVNSDERIRLAGKGDPGIAGGPPGHLMITVTVRKHPLLTREGKNLYLRLPISIPEAINGAKINVPTPQGGLITLTVPKRSQNGQKLRLKGKGAPATDGGKPGDLYVVLDVKLPTADEKGIETLASQLEQYYTGEALRPEQL